MNLYQTKDPVLTTGEIEEGFLHASKRDLELAKMVEPSLIPSTDFEGGYTDGEFYYYSVKAEVEVRTIAGNWHEKQVWARSYIKCYPGGRWDPDEFDEVRAEDGVYLSLSDAVKQTKLDGYKRELWEISLPEEELEW